MIQDATISGAGAFHGAATGARARPAQGLVHRLALAAVWLTFASSGIVFAEPAPVDVLLMGLVVLLPLIGLVHLPREILAYAAVWMAIAATGLLASPLATDVAAAAKHTAVSLYLSLASLMVAAFVARSPLRHAHLILGGMLAAATVATAAALAGYFDLAPGAADLFTRFGRAAGTFKDPNVYGAFLVLPTLYALTLAVARPLPRALPWLALAGVLALGVLLSFSRGAWACLALGVLVWGYLAFATAETARARLNIAGFAIAAVLLAGAALAMALQIEKIEALIAERASLTQSYDVGPEGRFGGQEKALDLVASNPLGIGAQEFAATYHHEEVHNVYLSMALNAGWLGGALFLALTALTLVIGFRAVLASAPHRPLLIAVYSAFLATALEGVIIDTDHWRHLYVLMGLVWGFAYAAPVDSGAARDDEVDEIAPPVARPRRAARMGGRGA